MQSQHMLHKLLLLILDFSSTNVMALCFSNLLDEPTEWYKPDVYFSFPGIGLANISAPGLTKPRKWQSKTYLIKDAISHDPRLYMNSSYLPFNDGYSYNNGKGRFPIPNCTYCYPPLLVTTIRTCQGTKFDPRTRWTCFPFEDVGCEGGGGPEPEMIRLSSGSIL